MFLSDAQYLLTDMHVGLQHVTLHVSVVNRTNYVFVWLRSLYVNVKWLLLWFTDGELIIEQIKEIERRKRSEPKYQLPTNYKRLQRNGRDTYRRMK